jgi:crooked neck
MDMPELLWKAYIDFEYEEAEWERTRTLYERLLSRTSHVKVWISFATVSISFFFLSLANNVDVISDTFWLL